MGEVIGELLPLALGVAISPAPIIAVILILLGPRARSASVGFLAGYLVGTTVVVGVVALVVDPVDDGDATSPSTLASVVKMVIGALAVLLAVKQWRGRPRAGQEPVMPKWMGAIDTVTAGKAVGLGALLSSVANPKNLMLCLAAGVAIGGGGLSTGDSVVAVVVFVLLGTCTVGIPVVGYVVARRRMQVPLDELRVWLAANNATVMAVVLVVLGVVIFGKGLSGL